MALTNRRFGVEIEHGNIGGPEHVRQKLAKKFKRWDNVGSDGSGVEVRSPILKGQSGLDQLGEVMEFLVDIGGWVSRSDGMHVHHDAADFGQNARAVHRLQESYMLNQSVIDQIVDPYRRLWQQIDPNDLARWKELGSHRTGRRNVHYSDRHGTVEFRQFEGCLNGTKAAAWVEFGQSFVETAVHGRKRYITCANSPDVLFRRIGCRETLLDVLGNRPTSTELLQYTDARAAAARGTINA